MEQVLGMARQNGLYLDTNQYIFISSLGIIYSNDYQSSINLNWESVLSSVQTKVRTMQNIQLTIYQRSVILNCIIYSKIWYVAHVFPLPISYANKIKMIGFNFIWARNNYEPVKRFTLSLPKHEGGLGIIDILYKSQSILIRSFIKMYLSQSNISFMAEYYNSLRVGQLFDMNTHCDMVSYIGTELLQSDSFHNQKCIHVHGFPLLNAKQMYLNIMPIVKPTIESIYLNYKWKTIQSNLCSVFVLPKEREVIFWFLLFQNELQQQGGSSWWTLLETTQAALGYQNQQKALLGLCQQDQLQVDVPITQEAMVEYQGASSSSKMTSSIRS